MRLFLFIFALVLIFLSGLLSFSRSEHPFFLMAFLSDRDGNSEIFTLTPDGKTLTQVTRTTHPAGKPAGYCEVQWYKHQFLMFGAFGEGTTFYCPLADREYAALDPLNGQESRPTRYEPPLAWSEDFTERLYIYPSIYMSGSNFTYDLYSMNGDTKQVIASLGNILSWWAGQGDEWLVFVADPDDDLRQEIFRVREDGTGLQKVRRPVREELCAPPGVAGEWVYFTTTPKCNHLYRANLHDPDFRAERVAVLPSGMANQTPQFLLSPDERSVVYTDVNEKIFLLEDRQLTPLFHPVSQMRGLVWASDSQWLALTLCADTCQLYRLDIAENTVTVMTAPPFHHAFPAFSPLVDKAWHSQWGLGIGVFLLVLGIVRMPRKWARIINP